MQSIAAADNSSANHRWERCIGGLAVFLLGIILGLTQISTWQPPQAMQVYGASTLWHGHSAYFRLVAVQAANDEDVAGVQAHVALYDASGLRAETQPSPGGVWCQTPPLCALFARDRAATHVGEVHLSVPDDLQDH